MAREREREQRLKEYSTNNKYGSNNVATFNKYGMESSLPLGKDNSERIPAKTYGA